MTLKKLRRIQWQSRLETGNIMVDRQHRGLIDLVNLLLAADGNDEGDAALGEAFDALRRYVERHFSDEERLLEAVDSRHLQNQRRDHQMLGRELDTLWAETRDVSGKMLIHELAQWAEYRLLKHFMTADSKAFRDIPFAE